MGTRFHAFVSIVVVALSLASQPVDAGRQLSIVAQPGDVFHGYTIRGVSDEESIFSMNDDGEIAFVALVEDPLSFAIMTHDRFVAGAGMNIDGVVPIIGSEDYDLWINNRGQVAFGAEIQGNRDAIFFDGRLVFSVGEVDGRTAVAARNRPVADDQGRVTFEVNYTDAGGGSGWATVDRAVIQSGMRIGDQTIRNVSSARGNRSGEIAFIASTFENDFRSVFTPEGRVIGPGDLVSGVAVTTVSDLGNINSSGKITTTFVTGTTDRTRYVAVDDTAVLRDGDVIDGHELVSIVEAQLSGNEELVVYGWIPTDDGESLRRALFAGEGLILMEGQNLDGRTVARIRQNFEVNHRGDVAFQVVFNNGDHVLLLSTVPEPSAVATIILGFGSVMILFRRGP